MDIRVEAIDHVVLTVRDLLVTIDFYELVLGMEATVFAATAGRFGSETRRSTCMRSATSTCRTRGMPAAGPRISAF